jgi:hypothetical protein
MLTDMLEHVAEPVSESAADLTQDHA